VGWSGGASAQSDGPVRIGMIYSKQGPGAAIGEYLQRGSELAVEQAGRKVLGRPIELVWLDEPNPQVSQQNMQRLADENKVVAVVGGNYSSSALAMMSVANREKLPLILTGAAASEITGKNCSRYTFRTQATVPVQMKGLMPYVSQIGKKVYFITASYAFGRTSCVRRGRCSRRSAPPRSRRRGADQHLGLLVLHSQDPPSETGRDRGGLVGGDFSNFLKQWNEMGMKDKIPYAAIAVTTPTSGMSAAASTGIYVKPWYYNNEEHRGRAKLIEISEEVQRAAV